MAAQFAMVMIIRVGKSVLCVFPETSGSKEFLSFFPISTKPSFAVAISYLKRPGEIFDFHHLANEGCCRIWDAGLE